MRVCQACDAEYVDDPPVCRSCGAATLTPDEAALQDSMQARISSEKLVAVHELEGPVDEAIIGQLLAEAGIPHAIQGGSSHGPLTGVDHGVGQGYGTLLVLEEHVDDARQVVERYQRAVVVEHPDEPGDPET